MVSSLTTDRVRRVLAEIQAAGADARASTAQRLAAREAELGGRFYRRERAEIVKDLPLAIAPEVGQILYALVIASRPSLVVEFGGSMGFSTIYLASALKDLGAGSLITTELIPNKADRLSENLGAAGTIWRGSLVAGLTCRAEWPDAPRGDLSDRRFSLRLTP